MMLDTTKPLTVRKRGGGTREIPPGRWWVNRNTPVGEDAEVWERMAHYGRREIPWSEIVQPCGAEASLHAGPDAPISGGEGA